jgi:dihydrofolate synthase/folylpolyglutamate synthase
MSDFAKPASDVAELAARLRPLRRFGVNLGLSRITRLLSALGDPQTQVPVVHVAGTNGKGSTCAFLASILQAAGYRVGRFTSPHLVDWTERIQVNGQAIAATEFQSLLAEVQAEIAHLQTLDRDTSVGGSQDWLAEPPTQFEVVTAIAWLYFVRQRVDIAVMEVGLGGRLDATNVVEMPLVAAIVSISRDHWQVLGDSLTAIAREKAGILKARCPAVLGPLPAEAQQTIEDRAIVLGCPLDLAEPAVAIAPPDPLPDPAWAALSWARWRGITYPLPLAGAMQLINSAVALATIAFLRQQGWEMTEDAIRRGMAQTRWPGRIQPYRWRDHPIFLDGAHNEAAAIALRHWVDHAPCPEIIPLDADPGPDAPADGGRRAVEPVHWVMGILSNKDAPAILRAVLRPGDTFYGVPIADHAAHSPDQLGTLAQQACPELVAIVPCPNLANALDQACAAARPAQRIIVCGSLYLLGELLRDFPLPDLALSTVSSEGGEV